MTPVTPTQYTNPAAVEQIRSRRSGVVVGATSGITATPARVHRLADIGSLVERQVGKDHPVDAGRRRRAGELVDAEAEHGVDVCHHRKRDRHARMRERRAPGRARSARVIPWASATCPVRWMVGPSASGSLNGMPTSAAMHPALLRASQQCAEAVERRIAGREIRDQPGAAPIRARCECRVESCDRRAACSRLVVLANGVDVLVSSPAETDEHDVIGWEVGGELVRRRARRATNSSAGMIPSSRQSSWNAASASASVAAWYTTRPLSRSALCSGPTPG